jgi:hypothetical protein
VRKTHGKTKEFSNAAIRKLEAEEPAHMFCKGYVIETSFKVQLCSVFEMAGTSSHGTNALHSKLRRCGCTSIYGSTVKNEAKCPSIRFQFDKMTVKKRGPRVTNVDDLGI